jgi:hypothetical protein
VNIGTLPKDIPFPVLRAERLQTRYGTTVLLTLRESVERCVNVFLPKRFTQVFTDDDIAGINDGRVTVNLTYHGQCEQTSAYQLSLAQSGAGENARQNEY